MADLLTPEQWLGLLQSRLARAQPAIQRYEDYAAGRHRLAFDSDAYRDTFGTQLSEFATNWCGLAIDVVVERLSVIGFRFTETAATDVLTPAADIALTGAPPISDPADDAGGNPADSDAWAIWQANGMDAESVKAHTESCKLGVSFVLVGPPGSDGVPRMTVEHPSQVIVVADPADHRRRIAALKRYNDANGDAVAVVYTPDKITTFRTPRAAVSLLASGVVLPPNYVGSWETEDEQSNPLGIVPVVPIYNNPQMIGGGISDLRPAIALNDAANKFFSDMIVASEYAAFPQRVLTGVELPKDRDGNVLESVQLEASLQRLWSFEPPDAKVTSLQAADLGNYVQAIDTAVQHLAAQTRTPPHYLLAKLANLSADALQAAEAGLVAKAVRKQLDAGDAWEEAMRLAFRWRALWRRRNRDDAGAKLDEVRGTDMAAETVWRNAESRSPAVIADALVKKRAIGVPEEALWEEAGYTPRQIQRMRMQRRQELDDIAARQGAVISEGGKVTVAERDVVPGGG